MRLKQMLFTGLGLFLFSIGQVAIAGQPQGPCLLPPVLRNEIEKEVPRHAYRLSFNPATWPAKIPAEVVVGFSKSVFSDPTGQTRAENLPGADHQ
jgi:hypothetical protein